MKFISQDNYDYLYNRLKANDSRDAVMILLTLDLGLRSQELLNICRKDIDLEAGTILIKTLKKGANRVLPLPTYLIKYVKSLKGDTLKGEALKGDSGRIFPISRQRLFQIWSDWRVNGYKFHSLRHTCARRLYTNTKDVRLVQKMLGHKSLSSTTIYLDEEYSLETLKKTMGVK